MESGKTTDDLDFHSNLTLQTMLNAGGDATAGYLKEQTGLDQTAQIHYRMDEWLIPLDLSASPIQDFPAFLIQIRFRSERFLIDTFRVHIPGSSTIRCLITVICTIHDGHPCGVLYYGHITFWELMGMQH
jgi:hypothetical protein